MSYHHEEDGPEFEGKAGLSHIQSEEILGVIDWEGVSIEWADIDDEAVHKARLANEHVMEVIAVEPGAHAVVNRMTMVRRRKSALQTVFPPTQP